MNEECSRIAVTHQKLSTKSRSKSCHNPNWSVDQLHRDGCAKNLHVNRSLARRVGQQQLVRAWDLHDRVVLGTIVGLYPRLLPAYLRQEGAAAVKRERKVVVWPAIHLNVTAITSEVQPHSCQHIHKVASRASLASGGIPKL